MARRYCGKVRIYLTYVDGRSPAHELGARPDGYEWRIVAPGIRERGFTPHSYSLTGGMHATDSPIAYDNVAEALTRTVRGLDDLFRAAAWRVTRRAMP